MRSGGGVWADVPLGMWLAARPYGRAPTLHPTTAALGVGGFLPRPFLSLFLGGGAAGRVGLAGQLPRAVGCAKSDSRIACFSLQRRAAGRHLTVLCHWVFKHARMVVMVM